jgi:hypothetical protein
MSSILYTLASRAEPSSGLAMDLALNQPSA